MEDEMATEAPIGLVKSDAERDAARLARAEKRAKEVKNLEKKAKVKKAAPKKQAKPKIKKAAPKKAKANGHSKEPTYRLGRKAIYPFETLAKGKSFFIPDKDVKYIRVYASTRARILGGGRHFKVSEHKVGKKKGVSVYRDR